MEKINIHNYEAFFLDFAEGNLSPDQIIELDAFLEKNPTLRDELAGFEILPLSPAKPASDEWSALKKPGINDFKSNADLRDAFFVDAIENQLNSFEKKILTELISEEKFKKEYELWQNVILPSGNEAVDKQNLFQFGLDREIAAFNYEYYLIARTEGLLNDKQNEALEKFALARPDGMRDLHIADGLKLTPSRGIFYPDKDKLLKKDKPVLLFWLYRAAAIAAILILGVFTWINFSSPFAEKAPIVQQNNPTYTLIEDSLKNSENTPSDTLPNTKSGVEPLLEDWEVREPDPVEYAEMTPKRITEEANVETADKVQKEVKGLGKIEIREGEVLIASHDLPKTIEETGNNDQNTDEQPDLPEKVNQTRTFNSISEYAGDLLADKLNIPQNEKDEMALALARKITTKTGELLNAEYKEEQSNSEGDESLTYTLRIGSFKLSHTKAK